MKINQYDLSKNKSKLLEISLTSAKAKTKQVYIYEISDLSEFLSQSESEKVRQSFLDNKTAVKQISNTPEVPKFSENEEFINMSMSFRYIPENIYSIRKEVLIFDSTVAIYDKDTLVVMDDEDYALNQKQLFQNLWEEGLTPKLGFKYKPNHSFYNSIDYFLDELQIIVWPDAQAGEAYGEMSKEEVGDYLKEIIKNDSVYKDSPYIICFIWSLGGEKMVDIWKFNANHVDDRSGPLSEVRVYHEGKVTTKLGLASGNTLLVLGQEEKLRRQSADLKQYLDGPMPNLPLEVMNGLDFFDSLKRSNNE